MVPGSPTNKSGPQVTPYKTSNRRTQVYRKMETGRYSGERKIECQDENMISLHLMTAKQKVQAQFG